MIALREEARGRHVHVRVFTGPDRDHLALTGTLVFTVDEWPALAAALTTGCPGLVEREPCPDCGHGGHTAELCLAALAVGDVEVCCLCGDVDTLQEVAW